MIRNNLPKRFFKWIEFELGYVDQNTIDNPFLIKKFNKLVFFRLSGAPLLADLSIFLTYYNDFAFSRVSQLLDSDQKLNALDFYFNDIDILEDMFQSPTSVFEYFELPIQPFFTNVFYFDNYPFYNNRFEIEKFTWNLVSDNLLSRKFSESLNEPHWQFSDVQYKSKKYLIETYEDKVLKDFIPHYYLTKAFMSLFINEERHYLTFYNFVVTLLWLFAFMIGIGVIILNIKELSYFLTFYFVRHAFHMNLGRFFNNMTFYWNNPRDIGAGLRHIGWSKWLTYKMYFCKSYDHYMFLIYRGYPRLLLKRSFLFQDRINRRRGIYNDILKKWFW